MLLTRTEVGMPKSENSAPSNGYLYCVYDKDRSRYYPQACESARSLRTHDGDAHITLLTDREYVSDVFDLVIVVPDLKPKKRWVDTGNIYDLVDGRFEGKMRIYDYSPYQQTLYIDSDTYILDSPRSVFGVLDYFDMAMCPVAGDSEPVDLYGHRITGLTPYNCGVILFKKSKENDRCWYLYNAYYREQRSLQKRRNDQPYMMMAIANTKVRVHPLPRIYNARINRPISLFGKVVIAHGHTKDWGHVGRAINADEGIRTWAGRA